MKVNLTMKLLSERPFNHKLQAGYMFECVVEYAQIDYYITNVLSRSNLTVYGFNADKNVYWGKTQVNNTIVSFDIRIICNYVYHTI